MELGIAGKLALVVGASRDSGLAVARRLKHEGCSIAAIARGGEGLMNLKSELKCQIYAGDLTDSVTLRHVINAVHHSSGSPDIIVHVIGGSAEVKNPLQAWPYWEKVFNLNLGIAQEINRAFLPDMVSRKWGRIVHFSSNAVKLAIGYTPYAAAKAAVEGYVKGMGKEYCSKGVIITAVRPGAIRTAGRFMYSQDAAWTTQFQENYVPIKRWGNPDELSGVVAFLCSNHASYMAGAIVDVDGGMR